ncbi:MAG: LPXTG cell wall anchor domain-containing protein, partial [Niveispirillum sp.]|nr:LPXTG cell wall anchor domain-containing protein [Niveispirillum sp.]
LLTWAMSALAFEVRGRGMGLWQSSFAIGQFLSALVVPALAAATGGTVNAFPIIAGGALLVGLMSLLLLFRSRWSPA